MSIITFIKGLYNKYLPAKTPVTKPVIAKTKTAPRVRTTHVTADTAKPKTTPTPVPESAPPATPVTPKKAGHSTRTPAKKTTTNTTTTNTVTETPATSIIYPVIKLSTDSTLTEQDIISRKWLGDLMICYASDTPQGPELLQRTNIPAGMTIEKLNETAIENLRKNITYSLEETSFGGYELVAGGLYEASAICLPGLWQWLTEQFVDSLLVVIPAKDRVLFIPEQDNHTMDNLHTAVRQAFTNKGQLLTANIFRFNRYTQQWSIIGNVE
ncbi:hypothetical protein F5148DRAFT_1290900 [Russula earlei]|uniref:Uncharacterized protein n=1 Tax=Russula earlei TaxID=71964 RepID=A0ACC0TWH7_9AGAM|nr:hypothetical protein F5148DRAFT_1290900 [Russula earlei]